jgi:hypothetical protein
MLRALRPAVTHVIHMQTHAGVPAAVEAWTLDVLTAMLVLPIHTVVEAIAARVHWQTGGVSVGTSVVSAWTEMTVIEREHCEVSFSIQVYQAWRLSLELPASFWGEGTLVLVRAVEAVHEFITALRLRHALAVPTLKPFTVRVNAKAFIRFVRAVVAMVTYEGVVNSVIIVTCKHLDRGRINIFCNTGSLKAANNRLCVPGNRIIGHAFFVLFIPLLQSILARTGRGYWTGIHVPLSSTMAQLIT